MSPVRVTINNQIDVHSPPALLERKLKKALSFPNPAYEDAISFGRTTRGVSKKIRLYDDLNGTFSIPRGSWDVLTKALQEAKLASDVTDQSAVFDPVKPPKVIQLWEYQEPWVDNLLCARQGVGIAPPGAGKTLMALEMYARLGQPCLWVTHTKRLASQVAKRVKEFLGIEAGLIGAGKEDLKHFTIGLVPTLVRRDLSKYKDTFGLIIVDEAHHVPASTFLKVVSSFSARYRYGLTATPYREDKLEELLFNVLGPQLAYLDKAVLRKLGKLMTPTVIRRPTGFYFPYNPTSKKYDYKHLSDALAEDYKRSQQISTDVIVESTLNEKNVCIILVGRIPHGEILCEMIQPVLPETDFVHSKMTTKQSDQILDDFEGGKLRVLIATYKMLAEGFDYQPSNRLFLTAPFKGRALIEQACGRVERTFPGKTNVFVYDYVDHRVGVLNRQADTRLDIYEINNNPVITLK
jgi:superfamily II DNA or RNA helicase